MGLDIYFYKTQIPTSVSTTDEAREVIKTADEDYKNFFATQYDKAIRSLARAKDYTKAYIKKLKELGRLVNFPQFRLNEIGYGYDWSKMEPVISVKDNSTFVNAKEKVVKEISNKYDAYFRKVNFLFAYFQNNGSMIDEWYAPVTADDVKDIINRCEQVLADHDFAEELLPTQSGFFFGGTDYDKWYFDVVRDCKKQMKAFLRKMEKDNSNAYVVFSW